MHDALKNLGIKILFIPFFLANNKSFSYILGSCMLKKYSKSFCTIQFIFFPTDIQTSLVEQEEKNIKQVILKISYYRYKKVLWKNNLPCLKQNSKSGGDQWSKLMMYVLLALEYNYFIYSLIFTPKFKSLVTPKKFNSG